MIFLQEHGKVLVSAVMAGLMILDEHFELKIFNSEDASMSIIAIFGLIASWFAPGK